MLVNDFVGYINDAYPTVPLPQYAWMKLGKVN